MRSVTLAITPDLDAVPELFRLIADSEPLAEARLQEWNPVGDGAVTLFYVCDGRRAAVVDRLGASPLVRAVSTSPLDAGRFALLLRLDLAGNPLVRRIFDTVTTMGLIVLKPVLYREGSVHARLVGDEETLRRAVAGVPGPVDVSIEAVGSFAGSPETGGWGLTPRQREALRAAVDLGYYQQPRAATHGDVARELGCSSSTASEHLRKAEATLVQAAISGDTA